MIATPEFFRGAIARIEIAGLPMAFYTGILVSWWASSSPACASIFDKGE